MSLSTRGSHTGIHLQAQQALFCRSVVVFSYDTDVLDVYCSAIQAFIPQHLLQTNPLLSENKIICCRHIKCLSFCWERSLISTFPPFGCRCHGHRPFIKHNNMNSKVPEHEYDGTRADYRARQRWASSDLRLFILRHLWLIRFLRPPLLNERQGSKKKDFGIIAAFMATHGSIKPSGRENDAAD